MNIFFFTMQRHFSWHRTFLA